MDLINGQFRKIQKNLWESAYVQKKDWLEETPRASQINLKAPED